MKVIKLLCKCMGWLTCLTIVLVAVAIAGLYYAYQVVDQGTLTLPNAPGNAVIVREADSGIAHIRGDDFLSVAYA